MLGRMEPSSASARNPAAEAQFLFFWGKARPASDNGPRFHPVVYHLIDVAAVAEELLRHRRLVVRRLARLLGLGEEDARALVVALAGLHDLGKFAPAFQAKAPEHWPAGVLGPFREELAIKRHHTEDGFVLWDEWLEERLVSRVWENGTDALRILAPAVFGHHGRPVGSGRGHDPVRHRFRRGLAAAEACADAVLALLLPHPIHSERGIDRADVKLASWLVSGLLTIADWVGSRESWFPYVEPAPADVNLGAYLGRARSLAKLAVREAGLIPSRARSELSFSEVARVSGSATPVQQWASDVPLPEGPSLFLIEDVTGSGKTEAAQVLVHRLISAGRASGAYWGMPTMATANAMYARQAKAIGALYARENANAPSLVLAHGQQALHEGFRSTVLREESAADESPRAGASETGGDDDELDSSVACAVFLADDRRAALLADVGVGTVDQAILGVLPSRFNTMRLLGLCEKVLVVDEAHAYDAYMGVEIQELLRFHAAFGGSVVVLSATLSAKQRRMIAEAWADGIAGGGRLVTFGGGLVPVSSGYPLATTVSAAGLHEEKLETAPWSHRSVGVRLVHDIERAITHVLNAQSRGGAVAWVRNTVDDCLDAAARLRDRGVDVLVFHARFAQGDRQEREAEVMRLFGKGAQAADRTGRVLVATQVIEQSLDLDFDAMVSDLAPIDLLVQRAGRLWRHSKGRSAERPGGLMMELVVFSPVPTEEPPTDWLGGPFAGTAHVYENAGVLWRTVRALTDAGAIETPKGLRPLIERVYSSDEVPSSLLRTTQGAEGKASAHAATANFGVLKPREGYHADAAAWVSDIRMPTRLGDLRTTVRLARVGPDGILEPWVRVSGPGWKSWALSEVSVSAYRVALGSEPEGRFVDAVNRLREGWRNFEQDIPVLVLEEHAPGDWRAIVHRPDGRIRQLAYSPRDGLSFLTTPPKPD
jgi:CRISPR-associated endonuclease/helicase Cas3